MPMSAVLKFFGVVLVAAIVIIELYLLRSYWSIVSNVTNVEKAGPLIQSIVTPLVSVLAIIASYLVINYQFDRNKEIEKVKQQLGETYKRESDAYFKIWSAISSSYRLVSELQRGTFDPASKDKIDAAFAEAEPSAFILKDDHRDLFYSYWQSVRETAAKGLAATTNAERVTLWTSAHRNLGDAFYKIQNDFRKEYLGN
jgi:hypothetical protein